MIGLYTTIEIDAAPAQVWAVITDFPAYPAWSGFKGEIRGEARLGAWLTVIARPRPGKMQMTFFRVTKVVPESELCWRAHYAWPYLLYGDRFWVLEPLDGRRRCRLTQGEMFKGPLSFLVRLRARQRGDRGYREMCDRLKAYVEQRVRG